MTQLIGYVSDESHVAIEGAVLEFIRGRRRGAHERGGAFARERRGLRGPRARRVDRRGRQAGLHAEADRRRGRAGDAPEAVPAALGPAARLRVAQVGPGGRAGRAADARHRAVLGDALALRLGEGAGRGPRPVRFVRAGRRPPDRARRGLRLDRLPVEPPRLPVRARQPQRHHRPRSARLLLRPHDRSLGRVLQLPADRRAAGRRGDRRRRRAREHDGLERLQRLRRPLATTSPPASCRSSPPSTSARSRPTCATPAAAGGAARTTTTRRSRSTARSPSTGSTSRRRSRRRCGGSAPSTSHRPPGGWSAGSSARASRPTCTRRTSSTRACSTSTGTRC